MDHVEEWKAIKQRYLDYLNYCDKDIKECLMFRVECIDELLEKHEIETKSVMWNISNVSSPCVTVNPPLYDHRQIIDEII